MKISSLLSCLAVVVEAGLTSWPPTQHALLGHNDVTRKQQYLIELLPGVTEWITEDRKWELRRAGINFMDITDTRDLGAKAFNTATVVKYPRKLAFNATIKALLKEVDKLEMKENLDIFTAFHTRFYKSPSGAKSSRWLLERVNDTVSASGAFEHGAVVKPVEHPWGQSSVIAHFPGKSNKTIIIGAHQDSISMFMPWLLSAPGADDDGSGTVTILEALRVLLKSHDFIRGKAENTVEFHWYSAEEGGLLGSQAIFSAYEKQGRDVKAMFQQDLTGYVQKTLDAGEPECIGVITDFVSPELTSFILKAIDQYCDIPYVLTKCGYACSDHASARKVGYPSAFAIESDFKYIDDKLHTSEDKIEYLSFDHMEQHVKLTLSVTYELAFASFD